MKVSRKGTKFVASFEGFLPCPYWDDYGKVWTIGYGETEGVGRSTKCISEPTARRRLGKKLSGQYLDPLRELRLPGLRQCEKDALASIAYNNGPGILSDPSYSTLARRLHTSEARTYEGRKRIYRAEFPKWNKSGGSELLGLTRRRFAEVRLACRGDYSAD